MSRPRWMRIRSILRLALLGALGTGIAGCDMMETNQAPLPTFVPAAPGMVTAVPQGTWGQPDIVSMTVLTDAVTLQFTCGDPIQGAVMRLEQGVPVDAGGHFAAQTTWIELPSLYGGIATPTAPADQTPVPPPFARLSGSTDGRTLALNVEVVIPGLSDSPGGPPLARSYGPYHLTLGQGDPSRIVPCTPRA